MRVAAVALVLFLVPAAEGHAQTGPRIHGKVVDSSDGPIQSVLVRLYRGTQKIGEHRTQADGSYDIQFTAGTTIDKIRYDHSDWHPAVVVRLSGNQSSEIYQVLLQLGQQLSDAQTDDTRRTLEQLYHLDLESGVTEQEFRNHYAASIAALDIHYEGGAGLPFLTPSSPRHHLVPQPIRGLDLIAASGSHADLNEEISKAAKKIARQLDCQRGSRVAVLGFTDPQGKKTPFGTFVADGLEMAIQDFARNCEVIFSGHEPLTWNELKAGGAIGARIKGPQVDTFISGMVMPTTTGNEVTVNLFDMDTGRLEGSDIFELSLQGLHFWNFAGPLHSCTRKGTLVECGLSLSPDVRGHSIRTSTHASDDLGNRHPLSEIRVDDSGRITLVFSNVPQNARQFSKLTVDFGTGLSSEIYAIPLLASSSG